MRPNYLDTSRKYVGAPKTKSMPLKAAQPASVLSMSIMRPSNFIAMLFFISCMGLMALLNNSTAKETDSLSVADETMHFIGQAELRWFGLKIYEAHLWAADMQFDGINYSQPVALSIEYSKNIPAQRLVSRTKKEWNKLGRVDKPQQEQWSQQLAVIWPDVKPGDMIASIVVPGKETQFFSHNGYLGSISDPEFGPEFLAIWLDANSRLPKLRNKLLGTTQI